MGTKNIISAYRTVPSFFLHGSGRDEVELRSRAVTDTEYGTIVKYSAMERYIDAALCHKIITEIRNDFST